GRSRDSAVYGFRDAFAARGTCGGSGDRRARRANLPDDVVCLPGYGARRGAVRASGDGKYLHADHESDDGCPGAADRGAGGRRRCTGGGLG
ncbi:MAG: O-acetylhomoserine sulfhydrylase / O-succinylhomoserine sulfhydrylase, partial [uncultured Chloroflexia bacterium]